jgi:hypothetical protein
MPTRRERAETDSILDLEADDWGDYLSLFCFLLDDAPVGAKDVRTGTWYLYQVGTWYLQRTVLVNQSLAYLAVLVLSLLRTNRSKTYCLYHVPTE